MKIMNRVMVLGLLIILAGLCGCASLSTPKRSVSHSGLAAVKPATQANENFSELNPYYKDRAAAFYDIKYVSPSAEALFKIADVRPEQMRKALKILRSFVDEWLDAYVEGNGSITQMEVQKCVERMDSRFDALFDSLQRKQYRIWRDDDTGEFNKLRFLISHPT